MTTTKTPVRAARRLNEHHERLGVGFYGAQGLAGRFFRARVRAGSLQVTPDFGESWQDVDLAKHGFCDHNGRTIPLLPNTTRRAHHERHQ